MICKPSLLIQHGVALPQRWSNLVNEIKISKAQQTTTPYSKKLLRDFRRLHKQIWQHNYLDAKLTCNEILDGAWSNSLGGFIDL